MASFSKNETVILTHDYILFGDHGTIKEGTAGKVSKVLPSETSAYLVDFGNIKNLLVPEDMQKKSRF